MLLFSCGNEKKKPISDINNLFPWAISAFDSVQRTPQERIRMIHDLGFRKYAYGWREHNLDEIADELRLAGEHDIEIIGVWLWCNAKRDSLEKLSPANQRMLKVLEENEIRTTLWLSFNNNFFEGLSQEESVGRAVEMVDFIAREAEKINCRIALYNHKGWFGNPWNQLEVIHNLPQHDLSMVFNFHHAHAYLDDFPHIVKEIKPYLIAVNLNGMEVDGHHILPIGDGDREKHMIEVLISEGYEGPWGVLGHVENADVKTVLERNLDGLSKMEIILE